MSKLLYGTILTFVVGVVLVTGITLNREPSIDHVNQFSSYDEMKSFLKENLGTYYGATLGAGTFSRTTTGAEVAAEGAVKSQEVSSEDYSTTNIQVTGVDEADIVKNDGRYIYIVSGNSVIILDAYPAENAKILSKIELNGTPSEIFINKDKLVVFEGSYDYSIQKTGATEIAIYPPRYYSPKTLIKVYDVSDRENPVLVRNVSVDGNYFDSRMIEDYVYIITNQPVYYNDPEPIPLPVIQSNGETRAISASEIYYFNFPDSSYIFTNILAINTQNNNEEVSSKTFLMGYSQNMYVSTDNIYIVYNKRVSEFDFYDKIVDEVIMPLVPSDVQDKINDIKKSDITKYEKMQKIDEAFQDYLESLNPEEAANILKIGEEKMKDIMIEIAKEMEKTVIHKISVNGQTIEYKTNGEVPGYVLNQFSMDEYNGYFRMATTTGSWRSESMNHVYVLDGDLEIVGKLEDLAQGERIYSARFIGDKGYMVTFRQIDPLFVIDLTDPNNPQVLGYLKIPGVSDYLHPYDETHLIGVGRDATEQGMIKGMKLSLFDIRDFANPKEISVYMIGERGTSSEALNDHKAFMFSKSKNLLVIPVSLVEGGKWNAWQGAYVFDVDLDNGFSLKEKVTHINETTDKEYYYDYSSQIRRSLYIDDVLYTVSSKMIKMNNLNDLSEINKVEMNVTEPIIVY